MGLCMQPEIPSCDLPDVNANIDDPCEAGGEVIGSDSVFWGKDGPLLELAQPLYSIGAARIPWVRESLCIQVSRNVCTVSRAE